ncbi:MAG: ATPase [Candidatus Pacebacteria bacterium]|nr:ATPase [Candidatus Paceibacterota bacterium]
MNEKKQIYIVKANGDKELFDEKKLEASMKRAGADFKIITEIIRVIKSELKDGMTTAEIYRQAFRLLNVGAATPAIKYSLRKAVMELGPQGFAFEDFVGAIFKALGFKVRLRQTIGGLCVQHEVDILAENEEKFLIGEIKFHNRQGIKSDLKVVLYVKERFDDISKGEFYGNINKSLKIEKWLITNTKFTTNGIQYAECHPDLHLMSWNYPKRGNLQELITESGLYPLTTLKTLSSKDKQIFLKNNIVLCRDILKGGERLFNLLGISLDKLEGTIKEINKLLN